MKDPMKAEIMLFNAAKLALLDLQQLHRHHYPNCTEGCPTHEAITALEKAIYYSEDGKPVHINYAIWYGERIVDQVSMPEGSTDAEVIAKAITLREKVMLEPASEHYANLTALKCGGLDLRVTAYPNEFSTEKRKK